MGYILFSVRTLRINGLSLISSMISIFSGYDSYRTDTLIFIQCYICSRCRLPCCRSYILLWENGCRIAKAVAANPRGSGAVPAYSSSRFCKWGRLHWVGVIVLDSLFQIGAGFGRFRVFNTPHKQIIFFTLPARNYWHYACQTWRSWLHSCLGQSSQTLHDSPQEGNTVLRSGEQWSHWGVRFTDRIFSWVQ